MSISHQIILQLACVSAFLSTTANLQAQQPATPPRTVEERQQVPDQRCRPGTAMQRPPAAEQARVVPERAPVVENRVVPGQTRAPGNARVIPGAGNREHVRPEGGHVIPGSAVGNNFREIPGTRPLGQRPVVARIPLPPTIVINPRCSPYPYLTRTPYAISKKGDLIELDDGSVWEVKRHDRRHVKRWAPGDALIIETGRFFSWSNYRIVNYTRNESADVEISLAPGWGGRSSHYIVEVNPMQGYVRLEDGSIWRMSASEIAQWNVNDDVILGLSKNWFSDQYTYVLINPRARNRIIAVFEF